METTYNFKITGLNLLTENKFEAEYLVNGNTISEAFKRLTIIESHGILQIKTIVGKKHSHAVHVREESKIKLLNVSLPELKINIDTSNISL